MELMQASKQYLTRPMDERYTSIPGLHQANLDSRARSASKVISSRRLSVAPADDDTGLVAVGPDGQSVIMTHWSFGQVAARAGTVNATDLRKLPPPLAADCINYGLHVYRDVEEVGVLLQKPENSSPVELRACTGPNYGRIWNSTVSKALMEQFGDGVTGDWRVPGEFGKAVVVDKQNTTLYASDRDMWVFLADEAHRIDIPGRGPMARGVFFWNSEVGLTTLGMAGFYFDYVCCNRIVWGATGYQEVRIRHTSGAPDRWIEHAMPAIEAYSKGSTEGIIKLVADARAKRIDKVEEFLLKRFSKPVVTAIQATHMQEENRPIETLWDATTGVTAYAKSIQYQDQRVAVEREAGKILDLAA